MVPTGLYEWQERVIDEVKGDAKTIMVVAPSSAGKTYLLHKLRDMYDGEYMTVPDDPSIEVLNGLYESDPELVLVDEAGMQADYIGLLNAINDRNATTVIATLPDVPSTEILKGRMDVVIEVE